MDKYIHLIGTEQVQSAASDMRSAAEQMTRAADYIQETANSFLNRFEDLVQRIEALAAEEREGNEPRHEGDCALHTNPEKGICDCILEKPDAK